MERGRAGDGPGGFSSPPGLGLELSSDTDQLGDRIRDYPSPSAPAPALQGPALGGLKPSGLTQLI